MSVPIIRGYRPHTVQDQVRFLCDPARVRQPAFAVIDRLQGFTPGEQMIGMGLALLACTQAAGINLHDVLTVAQNILGDADYMSPHMRAVRDYASNEIARGECETRGLTPESFMEMTGRSSGKLISYG